MGGKTSIQINVYRQTSPLPCSVSMSDGCSSPVRGWPRRDAGTQVLPALCGALGLFVGSAGVTQAGVAQSLREFCSLGERDKGDGEHGICCSSRLPQTAQGGKGAWRGMERGFSQCLSSWFSFGDSHMLRFLEPHLGRTGALPISQK